MTKYEPFEHFLRGQKTAEVRISFGEIEKIIQAPLPASARRHRAWWSNNPSNSVITEAWLRAGYESGQVDMAGERVTFRRAESPEPAVPEDAPHPLYGALKGMLRIAPGADLTAPPDPEWGTRE